MGLVSIPFLSRNSTNWCFVNLSFCFTTIASNIQLAKARGGQRGISRHIPSPSVGSEYSDAVCETVVVGDNHAAFHCGHLMREKE
ncbi:unnamed protein product [Soboliphyme baturini]|uniref:Secreted protein n=1 Tax=Soboliphyme baturini TaxID=241478 RepID=A0A183IS38_9BILA|nr:unnamed protein product [Soboliphyme baturini]